MSLGAVLLEPENAPDTVIDGLSNSGLWSLWVPTAGSIDASTMKRLTGESSIVALWHAGTAGARTGVARRHGRAFGLGSPAVKEVVSTATIERADQEAFGDVALAAQDPEEVARFMSRPAAATDSAAALFPVTERAACERWVAATLPLLMLWTYRSPAEGGLLDRDQVLLGFIGSTIDAGGVPMVLLRDEAARGAMALFAPERRLSDIAVRVNAARGLTETLTKQISRGLRSPLAP